MILRTARGEAPREAPAVGDSLRPIATVDEVVDRLVELCEANGIVDVYADQRETFMLQSAFEKRRLRYTSIAWTNQNKIKAVEIVRRWLREGQLSLPSHDRLRAELAAFEEKITPSGAFTFAGRNSHDDYVALLLTGAMADAENMLLRCGEGHAFDDEEPDGRDYWERQADEAAQGYRYLNLGRAY